MPNIINPIFTSFTLRTRVYRQTTLEPRTQTYDHRRWRRESAKSLARIA